MIIIIKSLLPLKLLNYMKKQGFCQQNIFNYHSSFLIKSNNDNDDELNDNDIDREEKNFPINN